MILLDAIAAGLVLGLLLRGSLPALFNTKLRLLPLLLISVVLSLLPQTPLVGPALAHAGTPGAVALALLRYGLLLAFVAANCRNAGLVVIGAGGACNLLVTLANAGRMPVSPQAVAAAPQAANNLLLQRGEILNYCMMSAETHLAFLCDRIGLYVLWIKGFVADYYSFGDLLLAAGLFLFILMGMRPKAFGPLRRRLYNRQA